MSSPTPREEQQHAEQSDKGQIALIVLVVLALAASLLMLFMNNDAMMKLAVLAALWAAVLGFFLVFRYRNQVEEANAALNAQRDLYEEKLERERADHRSEQLEIEQDYLEALREEHDDNIAAVREQLEILREQLEQLTGQIYYEPKTLSAAAERIHEIEEATSSLEDERPEPPSSPLPFDAETTVFNRVEDIPEPLWEPEPEPEPEPLWEPEPEPEPEPLWEP
ncbi:DUF6779 domain-containing protein, partial [Corynebacterium ciconiae]